MSIGASRTIVRLKDYRAPDVANRVARVVGSVADQLTSGVHSWTSKAKNFGATTDGLVRASPWRAAGAIALAAVAAGVLVSRAAHGRARRRAATDANNEWTSEVHGG
jgi:hypothetical protein